MRVLRIILLTCLTLAVAFAAVCWRVRARADQAAASAITAAAKVPPPPPSRDTLTHLPVQNGVSFGQLLQRAGLDGTTVRQLIDAASPVVNFRQLRPGQDVALVHAPDGYLKEVRYQPDSGDVIHITHRGDNFSASKEAIPVTTDVVTAFGKVNSSLFEAVIAAGERPELAVRLADIFAWDLDFYTDPRPGDTFRLVFERKTYNGGESVEYGRIFAAEYDNDGHPYQAVLFHDPEGRPAYYAADGKSLQKAFLRSPLKFAARISSHFSLHRYHPILKMYRAHLGTDYAAPTGTPVQAVANGRVEFAGRKGGDGNMVQLRHANGYESYYLHLSRIMVRPGQSVQQGQLIGRVGMTGLATGPHLDFRLRRAGQFVNFERMKLPPARPVAQADLSDFEAVRDKWMGQLPRPSQVVAQASGVSANGGNP